MAGTRFECQECGAETELPIDESEPIGYVCEECDEVTKQDPLAVADGGTAATQPARTTGLPEDVNAAANADPDNENGVVAPNWKFTHEIGGEEGGCLSDRESWCRGPKAPPTHKCVQCSIESENWEPA